MGLEKVTPAQRHLIKCQAPYDIKTFEVEGGDYRILVTTLRSLAGLTVTPAALGKI